MVDGRHRRAHAGINCGYQPLKEGYRGWGNGLALMSHLEGIKLDAAYEYLNWYNSGWVGGFIAKQGYYSANVETAKAALTENERGFFYEGKRRPRTSPLPPARRPTRPARFATAAPTRNASPRWRSGTTLMDEAEFLYAKWNEFNAA